MMATRDTLISQFKLLPPSLKTATRDTLMAAQQSFKDVNPEYLKTVIVQRCEFDQAEMGSAIPMDAGAVDAAVEDAGSLGQRGVGPGLGKGGPPRVSVAPTSRRLPPCGTLGWDKYDRATNNGFPPGTCGGCGAEDHFRNDCPANPNKGKYAPAKAKARTARARDGVKANGARAKESEE